MKLRWSSEAADDLESIFGYLEENYPSLAQPTMARIYREISMLKRFPRMGRPLGRKDVRALVIDGRRYVCLYRIERESVQLLHIFHTAQDGPHHLQ